MEKLKLKDKKQYLVKISKPNSIMHEMWQVGVYHKENESFNLNPTIHFCHISEVMLIEDFKKLTHHKDTTVGLYCIDFNPRELIHRFINSQSDACSLLVEDAEQLDLDWNRYIGDNNKIQSPFFQLKY